MLWMLVKSNISFLTIMEGFLLIAQNFKLILITLPFDFEFRLHSSSNDVFLVFSADIAVFTYK
jgi:hypothetical protein